MRGKLLEMLLDQEDFVSGEVISNYLGCSRTAVWKHIEELRKAGYEVEAVPRKGYRMIHKPNLLTESEIKAHLSDCSFFHKVVYENSVVSTQQVAHRLAQEGAKEGTIVVADEQTGGKGRLGRPWYSPIGTGIWMSLILKPKIPPQQAPQLTLLAAVAVICGIKKSTGLVCEIKWPNDILLNGKKLVGILTEMQSDLEQIHSVIVGIGINVNQEAFPNELVAIATSLKSAKGSEINRAQLMQSILVEFEELYHTFLEHGFQPIKELWETYAVTIGRNIIARTFHGSISGFAKGITDDGVLLLEDSKGEVHKIYSADIEFNVTNS